MVFGHRFDYNDEGFQNLLQLDNEAVLLAGSARAQVTRLLYLLLEIATQTYNECHINI